jgi:hypothetical protein
VLAQAGFTDIAFGTRFDCFAGTAKERTARKYGVVGVNISAVKSRTMEEERR